MATTVITGATDGIGRHVAARMAQHGHRVILLARDPAKAERVCGELARESHGARIDWVRCDLASLQSVREAAAEVARRSPSIDVLINNAAVYGGAERAITVDGHEQHLGVNYLAPFLLTHRLLPQLKAAPTGRIVNVSGETARFARIRMKDLDRRTRYSTPFAYGQSKLALILFTRSLARRLEGSSCTVNALHPGMVATSHLSSAPRWLAWFWSTVLPKPERAARSVARLALEPRFAGVSGRYYVERFRAVAPFGAYCGSLAEALYAESARRVGLDEDAADVAA